MLSDEGELAPVLGAAGWPVADDVVIESVMDEGADSLGSLAALVRGYWADAAVIIDVAPTKRVRDGGDAREDQPATPQRSSAVRARTLAATTISLMST